MSQVVQVHLRKGEDRRVKFGHPWVFSNQVEKIEKVVPGTYATFKDISGKILGHGVVNPHSLIYGRIFTTRGSDAVFSSLDLRGILQQADLERSHYIHKKVSYRALFGESDHLGGLVADLYILETGQRVLALQFHSAGAERVFADFKQEFIEQYHPDVFILHRSAQSRLKEGLSLAPTSVELLSGDSDSARVTEWIKKLSQVRVRVFEDQSLETDLIQGQKTGLFLDQRQNIQAIQRMLEEHREALAQEASKRPIRILDVCSYVGAWGVSLGQTLQKMGIDSEIHFVDVSEKALAFASENAKKYGLSHRTHSVDFLESDAIPSGYFDGVILDLPSMAKSKKVLNQARKGYRKANVRALSKLGREGFQFYVSASCSQLVGREDFDQDLAEAITLSGVLRLNLYLRGGHSCDHPVRAWYPEGEYLKLRAGVTYSTKTR